MTLKCTRGAVCEYQNLETGQFRFSVSQVLAVLDPHAFDDVAYEVLEAAQERGRTIHKLFAKWLAVEAGLYDAKKISCPPEFLGYQKSLVEWMGEHQILPVHIEEADEDPVWPVAGTPDAQVYYQQGENRLLTLVDLKTGNAQRRAHRVQLQMYRRFPLYSESKQMMTLYAQKDGSPAIEAIVQRNPADEAWAMNAVNVLVGRTHE